MEQKEFDFYVDQKITMWQRTYFTLHAESYPDAIQKVNDHFKNKPKPVDMLDELGEQGDYEWVYDSAIDMTKEENGNNPTIEVYDNCSHGEIIYTN